MSDTKTWNPLTDWRHTDINWVKVDISKEDLGRFTKRSDLKGLIHTVGFLLIIGLTGTLSYILFSNRMWVALAVALYFHGMFYAMFGNALHELSHNTVFATKWLNIAVTSFFGWLNWPYNPHFYRLSHQKYHHRYTVYQGSDGEDVPNYVELSPKFVLGLFFKVLHIRSFVQNLGRLVTVKPTSNGWRGRGYALDTWEQFILQNASERERKQVYRLAVASLIGHAVFTAVCIAIGLWFIPILVTFAPFYGGRFMGFIAGVHQHAACEPNNPDFRISCGDAKLGPLTSFMYWRMEYHIEHHMFAAIPCYNLKKFSRFVADQLPEKKPALRRILDLNATCKEKYGSWQQWRDSFGLYKGF